MNEIYCGKYLTVRHNQEKSLFIQSWNPSPKNIEDFQLEMLEYVKLYKKFSPKNTLWLQKNFSLIIDDELKNWIEINVNIPCFEYGNRKCAFVVGKDVLAHLQTIDAFEKTNSCIMPRHFAEEKEAIKWLENTEKQEKYTANSDSILYDGLDDDGNIILKIPTKNIKETLKNVHKSVEQESFADKNLEKAQLLTKREIEILKLMSQDKEYQDIADILFISPHTLRTHLKNIKKKLSFNSEKEVKIFSKFLK